MFWFCLNEVVAAKVMVVVARHLRIEPTFFGRARLFAEMKAGVGRLFNDLFLCSSFIDSFLNPDGSVT